MEKPIVQIKNLRKKFNDRPILNDVSLDIFSADLAVIIGPSGCGKSTLLRCLNALEHLDEGEIVIDGTTINSQVIGSNLILEKAKKIRKSVGMVFQDFNLFPHLSLLENLMKAPMVVQGASEESARSTAEKLLAKVGLTAQAKQYPTQLSGGQQQRGAIARALALSPTILLYDEPTSALDPELVDEVFEVMRQLDQEGMTQIVVTHEMNFARKVADQIIHMDQGVIVEASTPEKIFTNPQDDRTKKFLRKFIT